LPLGLDPSCEYSTQSLQVASGSLITLYTDGLTEARNVAGVELGEEAVNKLADAVEATSVQDVTRSMIGAVRSYIADAPYLRDDIAILNIRLVETS
jgi:serine phosphatase RsbU (regulator of sigma subunit)